MSIESDFDRATMIEALGDPAAKGTDIFNVIFNSEYVVAGEIAGRHPIAHLQSLDVSKYGIAVGDTLTINNTNYIVRTVEPDGTGMTMLFLEDQS